MCPLIGVDRSTEHAMTVGQQRRSSISDSVQPHDFLLDSACTRHIVHAKSFLTNHHSAQFNMVGVGDHSFPVKLAGSVALSSIVTLNNVAYVPGGNVNLVSMAKLVDAGLKVEVHSDRIAVLQEYGTGKKYSRVILNFLRRGNLFVYSSSTVPRLRPDDFRAAKHDTVVDASAIKPRTIFKTGDAQPVAASSSSSSSSSGVAPLPRSGKDEAKATGKQQHQQATLAIDSEYCYIAGGGSGGHSDSELDELNSDSDSEQASVGSDSAAASAATSTSITAAVQHARNGHMPSMAKDGCKSCITSSSRRRAIGSKTDLTKVATNTLDRLRCDLVGPITTRNGGSNIRVLSLTGKKYALVTVDEKSRFVLMQALEFFHCSVRLPMHTHCNHVVLVLGNSHFKITKFEFPFSFFP